MALFGRRRRDAAGPEKPDATPDQAPDTGQAPAPQPTGVTASAGSNAAGRDVVNSVAQNVFMENGIVLPPEACGPVTEVQAPAGLCNVPRSTLFVGRTDALDRLEAEFATPGGVVVQAVHGLGGIGKSALAAQWAGHRCTGNPRWWITADSRAAVDSGLADLARALQPALAGLPGLPAEMLTERAVQWLTSHDDWLLVLDNVEQPDDIRPLLDRVATGRLLITTRRATGWHGLATPVRLDVLADEEATELFTRVLHHAGRTETDGSAELCAELGHLPLAVEQAAAYCAETGTTPRAYVEMLASWPAEMFAATSEGGDSARTVARIWRLTLDRLADTPLTAEILRILAWYAPNGIPRSLLDGLAPPPLLTRALGRLIAYSMVTDNGDGTLTVHRLVQALARTPDPDDPHRLARDVESARDRAATGLMKAFPNGIRFAEDWLSFRALMPHVEALAEHVSFEDDSEATSGLLGKVGTVAGVETGAGARSEWYLRRAVIHFARQSGEKYPDLGRAGALMAAGDLIGAIPLMEKLTTERIQSLGAEHPAALTHRTNQALAYAAKGDLARAVSLFESVLADRVRLLGERHPSTLKSRNNLAVASLQAGDAARAVPILENLLADSVRELGEEHADTVSTRSNLGNAYLEAGDKDRAVPVLESAVAGLTRMLGEDHPRTELARADLIRARAG
ncbi:tetratricopeptide repeat protein [Streptomyces sp. NPDC046727]|uniref:tetratricopeptide repeat protein n=1 Tax=Streptomyces sp. NPDC046727 TaxID=3155373 RepID=UPI0033E6BAB3